MKADTRLYKNEYLRHVAFPMGGFGTGMFCVQGNGMLGNFALKHEPDIDYEPIIFSSLCIKGENENVVRVLEGQVPYHKVYGGLDKGKGTGRATYGLARFKDSDFTVEFPYAHVNLYDDTIPLDVHFKAWSPFIPLKSDDSSSPVAVLEYTFKNPTNEQIDAIYYFSTVNLIAEKRKHKGYEVTGDNIYKKNDGFLMTQQPLPEKNELGGEFYVSVEDESAIINTDWLDNYLLYAQINDILNGKMRDGESKNNKSKGASIAIPFTLKPNETKKVKIKFAWYVPRSNVYIGSNDVSETSVFFEGSCCTDVNYKPWYSKAFTGAEDVMSYLRHNFARLSDETQKFADAFYDTSLPEEVVDAIASNLSILKSTTMLRQTDGRIWGWEGTCDTVGCCPGSCTHVYNYAQSICNLFPELEQGLRKTEFYDNQNDEGHQNFRANLPISKQSHVYVSAADGQLGGIIKIYREWRISADTNWIKGYWSQIKDSIEYSIRTWDKKKRGVLTEPHHNTYDISFWGEESMCSTFYLGALKAVYEIGSALGEPVDKYLTLYKKGREYIENNLFNGEYFIQNINLDEIEADVQLPEDEREREIVLREGPNNQFKTGCLSDGVLGAWLSKICGLGDVLDPEMVKSHLLSVYKYNYKPTLIEHHNARRTGYALGDEGGLLLCTWPKGGKPSFPFFYSDEVWTGIEYQVASHLMMFGEIDKARDIVKSCRNRYDGNKRNPFNEYECGHFYARAMASYALIQSMTGLRYDKLQKTLYVNSGTEDFKAFLCTADGYATVTRKNSIVDVDVKSGEIIIDEIKQI